MAPRHRASCHQTVGQQNGTKVFDAACNHMRHVHVMWKTETAHVPERGQLQMSGYRGFREDARLLLHQRVRD